MGCNMLGAGNIPIIGELILFNSKPIHQSTNEQNVLGSRFVNQAMKIKQKKQSGKVTVQLLRGMFEIHTNLIRHFPEQGPNKVRIRSVTSWFDRYSYIGRWPKVNLEYYFLN